MLRGELVALRARQDSDVPILETELHEDVPTWSRSDNRPWRPLPPGSDKSPFRIIDPNADPAVFSVVELASGELAGDAVLWSVDLHNRSAHLGISLRPAFRGRGLSTDVTRVLCRYGFETRGLHRLQVETLADNEAMLRAATRAGFTREGVRRQAGWVNGAFVDEVILGQLAPEWFS
ncbi:MAG TPA: GNAT family protein [Streptosporangiaceae bacterium]|jgi:RimJ/RimL family protein N-acetyltransferase|nr:GNAT family protein [Streptosporangiaceae bacterium]